MGFLETFDEDEARKRVGIDARPGDTPPRTAVEEDAIDATPGDMPDREEVAAAPPAPPAREGDDADMLGYLEGFDGSREEVGTAEPSIDDLAEDFNRAHLDPNADDTTEEEAFVNDRIMSDLGGQMNDQRARMGRAGFGASGALAGLESDAMRAANRDASGQIYDIREREQGQAFDEGIGVQGMDIAQQKMANDSAILKAQIDAINAMLPKPGEEPEPIDDNANGIDDANEASGRFGHNPDINGRLPMPATVDVSGAEERDFIVGQVDWYFGSDDEYDYYESQVDGKILKHRIDAALGG